MFALISADQAEELRLFGPGPLSPITRRRIGTFLGIAAQPTALYYRPRRTLVRVHVAVHAGLSPAEMLIPLIVA
jgi:hypothetical protein